MKRLSDFYNEKSGAISHEVVSDAQIRHSLMPLIKAPGLNYPDHAKFNKIFEEQLQHIYNFPFDSVVVCYDRLPVMHTFLTCKKVLKKLEILLEVPDTTFLVSDRVSSGSGQFFFVRTISDKKEFPKVLVNWANSIVKVSKISSVSPSVLTRTLPEEDGPAALIGATVAAFTGFNDSTR